jgi:hypothetical protein
MFCFHQKLLLIIDLCRGCSLLVAEPPRSLVQLQASTGQTWLSGNTAILFMILIDTQTRKTNLLTESVTFYCTPQTFTLNVHLRISYTFQPFSTNDEEKA